MGPGSGDPGGDDFAARAEQFGLPPGVCSHVPRSSSGAAELFRGLLEFPRVPVGLGRAALVPGVGRGSTALRPAAARSRLALQINGSRK